MNTDMISTIEKKHAIQLTDGDVKFLQLYQEYNLDPKVAYSKLSRHHRQTTLVQYIQKLKNVILDVVEANLVMQSGKAASTLSELMGTDDVVPQANIKLDAAKTTLDRVGLGKKDVATLQVGNGVGLFIIPAKVEVQLEEKEIEGEVIENAL